MAHERAEDDFLGPCKRYLSRRIRYSLVDMSAVERREFIEDHAETLAAMLVSECEQYVDNSIISGIATYDDEEEIQSEGYSHA